MRWTKCVFKCVEIFKISETQLSAVAYGEQADFAKHVVYAEVKSVTFHELVVEQTTVEAGWLRLSSICRMRQIFKGLHGFSLSSTIVKLSITV